MKSPFDPLQPRPKRAVSLALQALVMLCACAKGPSGSLEHRESELQEATQGLIASPLRALPRDGEGIASGTVAAVGADPAGFLVLWAGYPGWSATRLDAHGVPTGDRQWFTADIRLPGALEWAGSHYVLISEDGLFTTRLTADGQLLEGDRSLGFAGNGDDSHGACDASECMITFAAEGELRAVRVAPDDTHTLPLRLASKGSAHDVVRAGEQWLAVASSDDGLWSLLFDDSNAPQRSLLTTSTDHTDLAAARLGEGFIVASRDSHPTGDTSIFLLDGSGRFVSEGQVSLPPEVEAADETRILALCGAADHASLVMGVGSQWSSYTAYVQPLDSAGVAVGSATELAGVRDPVHSVACGADTVLALDALAPTGAVEARTLGGTSALLTVGPRFQGGPALAHGSAGTLIAWADNKLVPGSSSYHIFARLLDNAGVPLSDEGLVTAFDNILSLRAASDGEVFLVYWKEYGAAGNERWRGMRLDANAQVLDQAPVVLAEDSDNISLSGLASGGFLVALEGSTGITVVALGRSGDPGTAFTLDGYATPALVSSITGAYLVAFGGSFKLFGLPLDGSGQPTAPEPTDLLMASEYAYPGYPVQAVARGDEIVITYYNTTYNKMMIRVGPGGSSAPQTLLALSPGDRGPELLLAANDVGVRSAFVDNGTAYSQLLECNGQGNREVRIGPSGSVAIAATGPSTWLFAAATTTGEVVLTAIDDANSWSAPGDGGATTVGDAGTTLFCAESVIFDTAPDVEAPDGSVPEAGTSSAGPATEQFETGLEIGLGQTPLIAGGEHGYLLVGCKKKSDLSSEMELVSAVLPLMAPTMPMPRPVPIPAEACTHVYDLLWTGRDYLLLFRQDTAERALLLGIRLDESGHNLSDAFKITDDLEGWTAWREPRAASSGEQSLVVFFTKSPDYQQVGLNGVRIDLATNKVLDPTPLSIDRRPFSSPAGVAVTSDGRDFKVAYALSSADIFGRAISADGSISVKEATPIAQVPSDPPLELFPFGSGYVLSWRSESLVLDRDLKPVDIAPHVFDGWVAANDHAHGALFLQGSGYASMESALSPLLLEGDTRWLTLLGAAQSSAGYLIYGYDADHQPEGPPNLVLTLQRMHFAPMPLGTSCQFDGSCSSSFCVDGVCCDEACGGGSSRDCQACSQQRGAASDGTCSSLTTSAALLQVCRPAAGPCDAPDRCVAGQTACPADRRLGADTICNSSSQGPCDEVDRCDGVSITCPERLKPKGWACGDRAIGGVCDLPDVCDGTTSACHDRLSPPDTVCRPAANDCDATETCDGNSECGKDERLSTPRCRHAEVPQGDAGPPGDGMDHGHAGDGGDAGVTNDGTSAGKGRDVDACSAAVPTPSRPAGLFLLSAPWLLLLVRRRQR